MKKITTLLIVLIISVLFVACGQSVQEKKATASITDNEGNTVELSAEEVQEIYDGNEAKFEKLYQGADISFIGTVESVDSGFRNSGSDILLDSIIFEEGWQVSLLHGSHEDLLIELSPGDMLEVHTQIYSGFGIWVDLRGTSPRGGYNEDTLLQTVITKVE